MKIMTNLYKVVHGYGEVDYLTEEGYRHFISHTIDIGWHLLGDSNVNAITTIIENVFNIDIERNVYDDSSEEMV